MLSWWLKPAAAYRDGIIDMTSQAITADNNGAYAIVVNGSRELNLKPNGTFTYHAALGDPGALKLTKTMTTDTAKTVRVLRSWKLRSQLAPKAGLRYDGLYDPSLHSPVLLITTDDPRSYRIESFGIKLLPPEAWHFTFTLSRLPDQPPMSVALQYPMSDQLDDWRDYQHLKHVDRGEDFDMLREILRDPAPQVTGELGGEAMERDDSGYFSRRSSKLSSRIGSIPDTLSDRKDGMGSTAESRINSLTGSVLEDVAARTPITPDSKPGPMYPAETSTALDGVQDVLEPSASDKQAATLAAVKEEEASPKTLCPDKKRETTILDEIPPLDESRHGWTPQWGLWRKSGGGLDGTEEGESVDWAAVKKLGNQEDDRENDTALREVGEGVSVDCSVGKEAV